jgi:hypothetical protein
MSSKPDLPDCPFFHLTKTKEGRGELVEGYKLTIQLKK